MSERKRQQKRGRSESKAPHNRHRRPASPPPPPASLVSLLQADASVLEYFRALQANLDADVQVWKDRATRWKAENDHLRKQLLEQPPQTSIAFSNKKKSGPRRQKNSESEDVKKNLNKTTPTPADLAIEDGGAPITDEMFDISSSSDDDEDGDRHHLVEKKQHHVESSLRKDENKESQPDSSEHLSESEPPSSVEVLESNRNGEAYEEEEERTLAFLESPDDRTKIFALLKEAFISLQRLGISLVDVVHDEQDFHHESNSLSFSNEEVETNVQNKRSYTRRPDDSVAADLMLSIRNLVRIPLVDPNMQEQHPLFKTERLIPCCNQITLDGEKVITPLHPSLEGKQTLLRTMTILDTFCTGNDDELWPKYFDMGSSDGVVEEQTLREMIRIGLQGRKSLVGDLMETISGEISETWACIDRSNYHASADMQLIVSKSDDIPPKINPTDFIDSSKRQARWSKLVVRSLLAQLCIGFYLSRNDENRGAQILLTYLLSTTPSLELDDHPRLPPVLSFLVIEALLQPDAAIIQSCSSNQVEHWFWHYLSGRTKDHDIEILHSFTNCLQRVLCETASIWVERMQAGDEWIIDHALVEMASFQRLQESQSQWLSLAATPVLGNPTISRARLAEEREEIIEGLVGATSDSCDCISAYSFTLSLVFEGDPAVIDKILKQAIAKPITSLNRTLRLLLSCSLATRQLLLRQLDTLRVDVGMPQKVINDFPDCSSHFSMVAEMDRTLSPSWCALFTSILECSVALADGSTMIRALEWLISLCETETFSESAVSKDLHALFATICRGSTICCVRVINLRRRRDRLKAFMSLAVRERLTVVKAVAFLPESPELDDSMPSFSGIQFGLHAFDGRGRKEDAEKRLCELVGSPASMDKLISPQWCPNDLKPFDREAPNLDTLVPISATERACALSHIASWVGVARSLDIQEEKALEPRGQIKHLFRSPILLLRLFKISGFAEGPALLPENETMSPSPVCVILEDDAILVDRFDEKLQSLLVELPRDFHFCSLGYSRPKTAPIVPYSHLIGIPSMQWYLTGYAISLAGALFLLKSLPVVGPVDSWIGLKASQNWDNIFGVSLGVGSHAKLNAELPSRKDLCRILHFRAFCALNPLCSQQIGNLGAGMPADEGRKWRNRDTDVEYSGAQGLSN